MSERGTYFGVLLYPDECPDHKRFLDYVLMRPQYEVCYIAHQPEEEGKKVHTHCLVHLKDKMTVDSFVKYFDPWIKHAVCIHNPLGYISYMIHDTPSSICEGKIPYSIDMLQGDQKLWRNLIQKSNFVQFGVFYSYFQPGMTLSETLNFLRLDLGERAYEEYFEYVRTNAFFIQNLLRDETNEFYRRQRMKGGET